LMRAAVTLTYLFSSALSTGGVEMTYTTDTSGSRTSMCHNSNRCVQRLNDGIIQYSSTNDWLVNGVTASNVASRMWIILDLGSGFTGCVGAIGVWNQNEYSDSRRQLGTFDLFAGDSVGGSFDLILSDGTLTANGNANPNPEMKIDVPTCLSRRYIKFVGKTLVVGPSHDQYVGIMELKLYKGSTIGDCCHSAGHCEWRGSFVMLDNSYCCPSGGYAVSDSGVQMAAGLDVRPTLVADTTLDTFTCKCHNNAGNYLQQACTHTSSPQGHVTMLSTTASATRRLS